MILEHEKQVKEAAQSVKYLFERQKQETDQSDESERNIKELQMKVSE